MKSVLLTILVVFVICLPFLAMAGILFMLGGRRYIGEKLAQMLPNEPLQKGQKVHIFLNGDYNRTATITKVSADAIYFYDDRLRLPLSYRGRFYGIGTDIADGSKVAYVKFRYRFRLIRFAELMRKLFKIQDDETNLNPDYVEENAGLILNDAEEGESDEV